MVERLLVEGNEAIARGAIAAGCNAFFGYPITPQSEIMEYMAREMPKLGRVFVQMQSELGSIYAVYGGGLAGERVMTSTSSPGVALMSEGIGAICSRHVPGVLVLVMRGGVQEAQLDYSYVTKAPGPGGHHPIVIAPWSTQESFDLVQLAFHLSEKYLTLVIILTDFVIGHLFEPVELRTLDFPAQTERLVDLCGTANKGGKSTRLGDMRHPPVDRGEGGGIPGQVVELRKLHRRIAETELRYETYLAEDANLLIVAYGSSARMSKQAVNMARAEGLKVGLFRPITVWPFPTKELREAALRAGEVLCVEDSNGQFYEDVEFALVRAVPNHLLGSWGRHTVQGEGIIHPDRILEEVKNLIFGTVRV